MPLFRTDPSHAHLAQLRDEGDVTTLAGYLVTYIASTKPGGGKASTGAGSTDPAIIPILTPLLESDPDRSVRRTAAYGLRRTGVESAVQPFAAGLVGYRQSNPNSRDPRSR